jgi:hypothetical protein
VRVRTSSTDKVYDWLVYRLGGKKAAHLGTVSARDQREAIAKAIEEFEITDPTERRRLIVQRTSRGWKRKAPLRPELAMTERTVSLKTYRALAADARAALRIWFVKSGSVPSEEYVEPPFTKEAEVLVRGILAIVNAKD